MTNRFKKGDKVRLHKFPSQVYNGIHYQSDMDYYTKEETKIRSVNSKGYNVESNGYSWPEEAITLVRNDPHYEIF